jgi:hypothetical protein
MGTIVEDNAYDIINLCFPRKIRVRRVALLAAAVDKVRLIQM